jgi:hypothetical protein
MKNKTNIKIHHCRVFSHIVPIILKPPKYSWYGLLFYFLLTFPPLIALAPYKVSYEKKEGGAGLIYAVFPHHFQNLEFL